MGSSAAGIHPLITEWNCCQATADLTAVEYDQMRKYQEIEVLGLGTAIEVWGQRNFEYSRDTPTMLGPEELRAFSLCAWSE